MPRACRVSQWPAVRISRSLLEFTAWWAGLPVIDVDATGEIPRVVLVEGPLGVSGNQYADPPQSSHLLISTSFASLT